ncbi:MAG: PAS domain-containing sensor histidine kinase [Dehalogenimonas sp.]|uniref:histidine kinase n=1 Tax=Candidatus Dehalogenimonas loeffleri TaxID=3127115 RepID=A0ABZ2J4A1_9CHLR|nr:PAS domain-containing sensor histidine kinase [Dehalogenimonas sp.]
MTDHTDKTQSELIAEIERLQSAVEAVIEPAETDCRSVRESEEKFRMLFHNANDAIFLWEIRNGYPTVLLEANKVAASRLGIPMAEMPDLQVADFSITTRAETEANVARLLQDRHGTFESVHKRRDGSTFPVEISSHVFELGGKTVILSIARDITVRKKSQEELTALYHREKDLRLALETEISKRIDFTRSLVHELKTPLTPMIASGEVLLDILEGEDELRLAGNIYRGALNLERRINDLLDFARGEMGVLKVSRQPLDICPLLLDLAAEVSPQFDRKQQSLELNLPDILPQVLADEDRLKQVLLNLLTNAGKFTPRGGQITLGAKVDGNMLQLWVSDNGRGIAQTEQASIFLPYYRVQDDNDPNDGMGIGLALCKMLVTLHSGDIWFTSEKGQGSTFYFTLPLAKNME